MNTSVCSSERENTYLLNRTQDTNNTEDYRDITSVDQNVDHVGVVIQDESVNKKSNKKNTNRKIHFATPNEETDEKIYVTENNPDHQNDLVPRPKFDSMEMDSIPKESTSQINESSEIHIQNYKNSNNSVLMSTGAKESNMTESTHKITQILAEHVKTGALKQEERIFCYLRIRPQLSYEKEEMLAINNIGEQKAQLYYRDSSLEYDFDQVFNSNYNQKDIFFEFKGYIKKLFSGRSCTIFAYGQTGSGKTYTMFGMDSGSNDDAPMNCKNYHYQQTQVEININEDLHKMGLIPRILNYIFELIRKTKIEAKISLSFFQIYREKIFDLQTEEHNPKNLQVRESVYDGYLIENLLSCECSCYEEALGLMLKGEENRFTRETAMNLKSSRAHTLLQIKCEITLPNKKVLRSVLDQCDLAGSERYNARNIGKEHMEEMKSINLSLTTLGKIMNALSKSKDGKGGGVHIPYRESILTKILYGNFKTGSKTAIISTVSPKLISVEETYSTIKFAQNALKVRLTTKKNIMTGQENDKLQNLSKEVEFLRKVVHAKGSNNGLNEIVHKMKCLEYENQQLREDYKNAPEFRNL